MDLNISLVRYYLAGSLFITLILFSPVNLKALDYNPILIDRLNDIGGRDNFQKCIALSLKKVKEQPDNFGANWRLSRGYLRLGREAKLMMNENWEETAENNAKLALKYAQKAIDLEPDRAEGYFYYAVNIGLYYDAVSIFTALRKGFKGKAQENLEKAYRINKMAEYGLPIFALARFWDSVPWPFRDEERALQLYKEYMATDYFTTFPGESTHLFIGKFLLETGGRENIVLAKKLLGQALQSEFPWVRENARELLD